MLNNIFSGSLDPLGGLGAEPTAVNGGGGWAGAIQRAFANRDVLNALIADHAYQQSMGALQGLGGPRMVQPPVMEQLPAFRPRGMSFADVANALGIAMNSQQGNQARAGAQIGMQRLDRNQAMQMQNEQANVNTRNRNRQSQYAAEQSAANNEFNARVRGATVKAQLDQRAADQAANRLQRSQTAKLNNQTRLDVAKLYSDTRLKTSEDALAYRKIAGEMASSDKRFNAMLAAMGNPGVSQAVKASIGRSLRETYSLFSDLSDDDLASLSQVQINKGRQLDQADRKLGMDADRLKSQLALNQARLEQLQQVTALLPIKARREWESMLTGRMNAEARIADMNNLSPKDVKVALKSVQDQKGYLQAQLVWMTDPAARQTILDSLDQLADREKELNGMVSGKSKVDPKQIKKDAGAEVPPGNPFSSGLTITPNGVKTTTGSRPPEQTPPSQKAPTKPAPKPKAEPKAPPKSKPAAKAAPKPKAPSREDQIRAEAKKALAAGVDPAKVQARLKKLGIKL